MADHQTRRRWIKIWTQETLHGTTLNELEPAERAVWFELLCLAGDSVVPGKICIAHDIPYTESQLISLLKVTKGLLDKSIIKLIDAGKVSKNGSGVLEICNWKKYQPDSDYNEYMANYMREYRIRKKQEQSDEC